MTMKKKEKNRNLEKLRVVVEDDSHVKVSKVLSKLHMTQAKPHEEVHSL